MLSEAEAGPDLLNLYLRLASSRGAAMPADALLRQFGCGIDRLLAIGAAHFGAPLSAIPCPACDESHSAEVAFDATSKRSWIFCGEAGRVWLEDAQRQSLHLNIDWLPNELTRALSLARTPARRTVIDNAAWLLGDMVIGSTDVLVALALGIRGTSELQGLIDGLKRRQLLGVGLLLVAPEQLPDSMLGVSGYRAIVLDQIAELGGGTFKVNQARVAAWIRALSQESSRLSNGRVGRTSVRDQILRVFEARRHRGEPCVSKASEAREIQNEWQSFYPDENPIGHSTARCHLPDLKVSIFNN